MKLLVPYLANPTSTAASFSAAAFSVSPYCRKVDQ